MKVGFFKLAIVLVMSLFLWVSIGNSATYYVDKDSIGGSCSDSNSGTITQPWCTLSKGAFSAIAGDTVSIRAGTYYETLSPGSSGNSGKPITFSAYNRERVIIDGSERITGWKVYSGNVYQVSVTFTPELSFWTSGRANTCGGGKWGHGGLVLQDWAQLNYCMPDSLEQVDTAGKYFMDDSAGCSLGSPCTLYVWLNDIGGKGYNPNNYEMRIGRKRKCIDLDGGQDYLTFIGLEVRGSSDNGLHSIGSTNITVQSCKFYTNHTTGVYPTGGSNNWLIETSEFWDNGHCGIELSGIDGGTVQRNLFKKVDLGNGYGGNGGHIMVGVDPNLGGVTSDNILVQNNVLGPTGNSLVTQSAVRVYGNGNKIYHNTAYQAGSGMYHLMRGSNNEFKNNVGHDLSSYGDTPVVVFVGAIAYSGGNNTFTHNDFYSEAPTGSYVYNGIFNRSNNIADWEANLNGKNGNVSTNNIGTNPLFVNASAGDFHLSSTSPAINAGTNLGVTIDFDGNQRPQGAGYDMGAYEFFPLSVSFEDCGNPSP